MNLKLSLPAIFISAAVLMSCGDDKPLPIDDKTGPSITMKAPTAVEYIDAGAITGDSDINIAFDVTDESELDQYQVTVEYAEEVNYMKTAASPWNTFIQEDIEGKSYSFNQTLRLPDDILGGPYRVVVRVFDEVGNERTATTFFRAVNRQDSARPVLTVNSPVGTSTYFIGDNIPVQGSASDNNDMEEVRMVITNDFNGDTIVNSEYIFMDVANPFNFSQNIYLPAGTSPSLHTLKVFAKDAKGNVTRVQRKIDVRN